MKKINMPYIVSEAMAAALDGLYAEDNGDLNGWTFDVDSMSGAWTWTHAAWLRHSFLGSGGLVEVIEAQATLGWEDRNEIPLCFEYDADVENVGNSLNEVIKFIPSGCLESDTKIYIAVVERFLRRVEERLRDIVKTELENTNHELNGTRDGDESKIVNRLRDLYDIQAALN